MGRPSGDRAASEWKRVLSTSLPCDASIDTGPTTADYQLFEGLGPLVAPILLHWVIESFGVPHLMADLDWTLVGTT